MKKLLALFVVLFCASLTPAAHADGLNGSYVLADLFFQNNPTGPDLFSPAVSVVGGGIEFSYDDLVATYTANFFNMSLIVRVTCDTGVTIVDCRKEAPFEMTFRDNRFKNTYINVITNDLNALYLPPVLFPSGKGFGVATIFKLPVARTSTIVFSIVPTPEPSGILLLGTGLLGLAGAARRRFMA